ncbi:MAG: hypothetical protein CL846_08335 [Crocinitomicaceae bacterium]|nr:hypothetical protein [Crocinitomicaceae bacterium]|tara:strand:+ start:13284 stop:13895 length:612 start_codon:yes stop_codon:yes gene_type:complete
MFRLYSILSLVIAFLYAVFSFFRYHDDFGWEINYYDSLTNGCSIFLVILLILKIQARWQANWAARLTNGFQITVYGWKKTVINEAMSIFILGITGLMVWFYFEENKFIPLIALLYFMESFCNLIIGKKHYKLIINSKLIFIITNKHKMFYWDDIKSFIKRHNGLIIQLKNGTQTHVNQDDFQSNEDWLEKIHAVAIEKKIYWE